MKMRPASFMILFWAACAAMASAAVSCNVSSPGVAFGTYSSIAGSDRDTSATITVTCTGTVGDSVSYSLRLSSGGGSYTNRSLAGTIDTLRYNLFTDIGRSQVWGDGSAGTMVVNDSYSLATSPTIRDYTVYGRIPGGQTQVHQDGYNDSITVELDY